MKKIFLSVIVIFFAGPFYFYIVSLSQLSAYSRQESLNDLWLEVIGSFVFGLIVAIFALFFDNEWKKYKRKNELKLEILNLRKKIRLVFKRNKSFLNIENLLPSFYLDLSHINPLYDLLTNIDSKWEIIIEELYEYYKNDEMVLLLIEFVEMVEETKICADKIDSLIKKNYVEPFQAATLDNSAMIEFYMLRCVILGANETDIFFKIRSIFKQNIHFEQVQNTNSNLKRLIATVPELGIELRSFIDKRRKLLKILLGIQELVEA